MLLEREAAGRPVTVGVIGAGKFGTMFLSQARLTRGMHVVAVADLDVTRALHQLRVAGWDDAAVSAPSLGEALARRRTHVTDDAQALIAFPEIEVIVEATGVPAAGIRHALSAVAHGKHIVMVNVEADALVGPLLARRAKTASVVYSLAWGDQPALICEHVDWARACGFTVVAAGKGTRYEPHYHRSTPDTVWDILDKYLSIADRTSINPKMFNSFVDGTKSGIEMTAVCNATGLVPQSEGLSFPPATRFELADICKPKAAGGRVEKAGVTEVTSSVYRDGRDAALYRPIHMIGLELGVSVASAALRKEPTGAPTGFRSDVAATAKRALKAGEVLDGEGGFCVWGKQVPAARSLAEGLLPLGLAHDVKLKRDIAEGQCLCWSDVDYDENSLAVKVRREMEAAFARPNVSGGVAAH